MTSDTSLDSGRRPGDGAARKADGERRAEVRPVAVVIGGGGGVGRVVTRDLARDHRVVATARRQADLDVLARIDGVTAEPLDLLDPQAVAAFGRSIVADVGRVDVLVHAAAVARSGTIEQTDAATWELLLRTNVGGPALVTRALLPAVRAARGTIVFLNSGAGERALPRHGGYVASKHALRGLADTVRLEEAPRGVRVSTIYPGQIATAMLEGLNAELGSPYDPSRYTQPESIARAVRWVAEATDDIHLTNIDIRPRQEVAAQFPV